MTVNIKQFHSILQMCKQQKEIIMIKADLVKHMAEQAGITQAQAVSALQAFETAVIDTLAAGETVELKGFGTFKITERAERQGRNPQTGATLTIPATKSPSFKAGKAFKDAVN